MNDLSVIPKKVCQNKNCSLLLTDRKYNAWKFLFEEIKEIPYAFADNQDFDFGRIDDGRWQSVIVPSSLVMQGFDIKNNIEYYYKRTIRMPKDYKDKRVFLRFEGVYSNARIWINNKFCAKHIGGFTVWDVDITEFAENDELTLVVGVADIEGDNKSIWNTNGEYKSNSAWASYYAHHNIGGIIRDITMFCLPHRAILKTDIETVINGSKSTAKIDALLSEGTDGFILKTDIFYKDELKASKSIAVNSQNLSFEMNVLSACLWDAEHPNLYTLKTALYDESDNLVQENTIKFGFREITYGGKNGTDKNKIYVNGREIKLRGVCRHDVSGLYGRSITKEDIYNEIKAYKEHNINHIRTSHYPASDYMLEVCDELGMYVEQENAACFKGANGFGIYNPPEDFLNSFKEMVSYSKNHPSVIIWSIANESDFEKSSGFRDCYNYIKKTDLTRPVIFSYPDTVKSKPLPYDIYSRHYAKVTSKLGRYDMPILHDEFAHVTCYNTDDLKYDNSCRVFWGESIKRGWDNIFNTSGALGCDIWAAVDDVFYLPEKSMEKHQTHLKGECAGYGEWGCIFDCFKRLKPEAYLTKKAFSPINIIGTDIYGDEIRFKVQNRFDHTNLNEVFVTVKDKNSAVIYSGKIKESIEPHCIGTASLLPISTCGDMTVQFVFDGISVESVMLNKTYGKLEINSSSVNAEYEKKGIKINLADKTVAEINGMHLYTGLNKFDVLHRELSRISNNTYSADFGFGRKFILSAYLLGDELKIRVKPADIISSLYMIGELGVSIELFNDVKSVSWVRNSLYGCYPDGHIARDCGTAYKNGAVHNYNDKEISGIDWENDMSAFAYYEKGNKLNSLAGNDFRTKRFKISRYIVNTKGGDILVKTDSDNINAYANPFSSKLEVGKGYYKQSILWGNYWGERFNLNKKNVFEFSVSFGKA